VTSFFILPPIDQKHFHSASAHQLSGALAGSKQDRLAEHPGILIETGYGRNFCLARIYSLKDTTVKHSRAVADNLHCSQQCDRILCVLAILLSMPAEGVQTIKLPSTSNPRRFSPIDLPMA